MKAISPSARGCTAVRAQADVAGVGNLHAIGQEAEVGLMHVQHLLHGLAGDADLLANYALTELLAALQKAQGDAIGIPRAGCPGGDGSGVAGCAVLAGR